MSIIRIEREVAISEEPQGEELTTTSADTPALVSPFPLVIGCWYKDHPNCVIAVEVNCPKCGLGVPFDNWADSLNLGQGKKTWSKRCRQCGGVANAVAVCPCDCLFCQPFPVPLSVDGASGAIDYYRRLKEMRKNAERLEQIKQRREKNKKSEP